MKPLPTFILGIFFLQILCNALVAQSDDSKVLLRHADRDFMMVEEHLRLQNGNYLTAATLRTGFQKVDAYLELSNEEGQLLWGWRTDLVSSFMGSENYVAYPSAISDTSSGDILVVLDVSRFGFHRIVLIRLSCNGNFQNAFFKY